MNKFDITSKFDMDMIDSRIIVLGLALVGLLALASIWGELFPSDVEIENINPQILSTMKYQEQEITFNLKNYGSEDVSKEEIHVFSPYATPKFLELHNATFAETIGAEEGSLSFSMKPFTVKNSEGSEITYEIELRSFINEEYTDSESISIRVIPSMTPILPFNTDTNKEQIIFSELNLKDFEIYSGEEVVIEFRVKSNVDEEVQNMKVDTYVVNNKSKFIEIEGIEISGKLNKKDDQTGKIEIPINTSGSEGNEIEYEVYLILYEGNVQMDVEKIKVLLKPSN